MATLSQRMKTARGQKNMSQGQLAQRAGVSQTTVASIESGRASGSRHIVALANALGVSPDWLIGGAGEAGDLSSKWDANIAPAAPDIHRVPVISYVQAGLMTEMRDPFSVGDVFEYLTTDLDLSKNSFALVIRGQSMSPEFSEGDKALFDPVLQPRPGDYVVAKNGGEEATFKRYRLRGINEQGHEVFELAPLNDFYPTLRSDMQHLEVIAVMVEHRKYRPR